MSWFFSEMFATFFSIIHNFFSGIFLLTHKVLESGSGVSQQLREW